MRGTERQRMPSVSESEHSVADDRTRTSTGAARTYLLRSTSLVVLTLQNAILILVMRYARTRPGAMFYSTTAVVMAEIYKTMGCLLIILVQEGGIRGLLNHLNRNIIQQPLDCVKISVPAIIYVLQNNLLYVAVSHLDASTYQVSYQLKILTTALFSVSMLSKRLSRVQWLSLVLLFIGVAIVQMQPQQPKKSSSSDTATEQSVVIGLIAICTASIMSGFAGVYFEKLLKHTSPSIFLRNVQLGVIGIVFGMIAMFANDGERIQSNGFFYGYDSIVWLIVFLQAFSGLVVAVVVKYADNILKGFATSAAIVVSCVASMYLFDFQLSWQFIVGSTLVILATYLYSKFVNVRTTLSTVKSVV